MTTIDTLQPGDAVVYALHGRGIIQAMITMSVNGKMEEFYKIQMATKTNKKTEVLVPKTRAAEMGLRKPLERDDLPLFFSQMAEPFSCDVTTFNWAKEEKKILNLLGQGKLGLAKALNQLHQTIRDLPVPPQATENTYKQLRSQVQVEVTQLLRKHHKQVRDMIDDALGGDTGKPHRKPVLPRFTPETPDENTDGSSTTH